jgi:hypothetical protein
VGKKHKKKQKESLYNIIIKAMVATATLITAIAELVKAFK